jgi:hypothetical protein
MRPHLFRHLLATAFVLFLTDTAGAQVAAASPKIPTCRLDSSNNKIIQPTLKRAILRMPPLASRWPSPRSPSIHSPHQPMGKPSMSMS